MNRKQRILFISPHNAARSQMMEGYLRSRYGNEYEAFSAGTEPTTLSPRAVTVMAEIGVDISAQRSKSLHEVDEKGMDLAVMVCPVFSWAKRMIRHPFPDPELLVGSEEHKLKGYRQLRDDLVKWIDEKFGSSTLQ